jgi:hypothetical protein
LEWAKYFPSRHFRRGVEVMLTLDIRRGAQAVGEFPGVQRLQG